MLIIGICGASGSGKSTLAEELVRRFGDRCVYLQQDCYYRDHPDMTFEEREAINYDEPQAFEHDVLLEDLRLLKQGKPITAKRYDYTTHRRNDPGTMIEPAEIILLDGIHVFYDPEVRNMLDFKIYVQVDPDICLLRRVSRDIRVRGRSVEGISKQYLNTVKPMYEKYIRNYSGYADLLVAQGGRNPRIIDMLTCYITHGLSADR